MKRPWFPYLVVGILLGLLGLLAFLQYRWLGQISNAEQVRLQARLKDDTKRFAQDFNREILTAYYSFQLRAEDFGRGDFNAFNKRLAYWDSIAKYPKLLKKFYFLRNKQDALPALFDSKKGAFEARNWTPETREIQTWLLKEYGARLKEVNEENRWVSSGTSATIGSNSVLAVPVSNKSDGVTQIVTQIRDLRSGKLRTRTELKLHEEYGFLVILLDRDVIEKTVFPDLVAKYFSGEDGGNYRLSVFSKAGETVFKNHNTVIDEPDSATQLFSVKPASATFLRKKVAKETVDEVRTKRRVIKEEVKTQEKKPAKNREEVVSVREIGGRDHGATFMFFEGEQKKSDGIWALKIQHIDGSLEQFVRNTRNRNLAISFGILSLLAVSMILIFFSSQRAKTLAQRQLDFVSSVSHEFRTPLSVIYSAGENLSDGVIDDSEKISRYGGLIKREGRKLSGMVEQILEFAGAKSGNRKYDLREVNAAEIVEDALAECQPAIEERDFDVEKNLPKNLPNIFADAAAMTQAVQNLINNALKYSNGSNWIRVSAEDLGDDLGIAVEDRGLGISAKDRSQIFEPFYRSESVVDEQISGNGLGLSLVKQIVEAHNGKIEVESEEGKGSKFLVRLPFNSKQ